VAWIIPLLGGVRGGSLGREISVNISQITALPTPYPLPRGDFLTYPPSFPSFARRGWRGGKNKSLQCPSFAWKG